MATAHRSPRLARNAPPQTNAQSRAPQLFHEDTEVFRAWRNFRSVRSSELGSSPNLEFVLSGEFIPK